MIHLHPSDYTVQPWKNGKGTTAELWRLERDGALLIRLSRAAVVEDGPFSIFPGVERNLTVLAGPGFRLTGDGVDLTCAPLVPVDFPGDVAVTASGTGAGPSEDFNVMTARSLPRPEVTVETDGTLPSGGLLALYALGPAQVNGAAMEPGDLILTETEARLTGRLLAVRLHP